MLTMTIYAVCGTLTAAGLWFAARALRRRRWAAGLRTAAVALLPIGLAMTGVVKFVVNMTVNPIAWLGFGVLGGAVLLMLVAGLVESRGQAAAGRAPQPPGKRADAGPGGRTPQALPRGRSAGPAKSGDADDFSEIEAILKKHGI
ncbi:hypothetical protein [Streptomyces sp. YIM 98790]|uniref:hypothetical protein n=1 Tax=Streptomyces sp. YIM 98790 TaxID=2689077 RepID=UPI001A9F0687|nr:hypothetical protein [Streptomyces sp. YIM 98790]